MSFNLLKIYNQLLELAHFNEAQKIASLKGIFNRDIENNPTLAFRTKLIRPIKAVDGLPAMQVLFDHLTKESTEVKDENGKTIKHRTDWDNHRCLRLHWVKFHIEEAKQDALIVFSYIDRIKGKDTPRTYLYDKAEQYVVILEPYRTCADYYLITAYHLTKEKGGIKQIEQKLKNKLNEIL
ncbi:MAG: hypothetical protein JST94_05545 [Bacteroidetes bacterium]|nr:hypothetical protein [Bacteroidota bacterium]MBS1670905.1 hypothetical protein [Bacteroidota bacterium]